MKNGAPIASLPGPEEGGGRGAEGGTELRLPPSASHLRASPWWLVALLSATATASYLCRVNLSVVGVLVMREFALTQVQMGPVFSAFLLTYAAAQVPAGLLADRWGARRVLIVAACWWAVATLLQSSAGAAWWPASIGPLAVLLAGRLLLGLGEAPTFTAAAQGISRWMRPASHGRANGFVIAAVGAGSAIAPPLLTWAMLWAGWRGALIVSAIPAIVMAVVWRVAARGTSDAGRASRTRDKARDAERDAGRGTSEDGRGPRLPFILLTASYSLQGYVGYIFVFWFYLYLVQERHFDLLRGAFLGSLPWVLTIVSVPLGGLVSDSLAKRPGAWRHRLVPMVGLVGAGLFIAVGARTPNAWVAALALAGATGLVMCVEGPFWATMTRLSGGRAGRGGGIMNMGCNVGGLISPALTPWLAARLGWAHALDVAAVLSVAGGLLWLGIRPPGAIDHSDGAS